MFLRPGTGALRPRFATAAGLQTSNFRCHARAFTLVEVILAISIAIGILVVALYFHSQASNLRAQLLEESDRVASIRLVMERLTAELRSAFEQPQYGFTGDATSLRFVTAAAPPLPGRMANAAPRTDLRLVSYSLARALEGTNEIATGLNRTEQPLVEAPAVRGAFSVPAPGPSVLTNTLESANATAFDSTNAPTRGLEPLTDAIRFVRLWFWDGYEWSATWDSPQLPRGVEINLGAEPLPEDGTLADYPGDLYRRVIYLPASRELDDFFDLFDAAQPMEEVASP
jgi:type II secretory pathway pseudopilin PulG